MWWMRIIGVPASGPPTRPSFARNSARILVLKSLASLGAEFAMISSWLALSITVGEADGQLALPGRFLAPGPAMSSGRRPELACHRSGEARGARFGRRPGPPYAPWRRR